MKNVKQRKMMLMLPVLVIPFLTMGFWALGGGKGKKEVSETKGLNLELPDANLKDDKGLDKLSFYDQAEKDSLKLEEWMRTDPYWKKDTVPQFGNELEQITINNPYGQRLNTSLYENKSSSAEDQLMQKLKALQDQLNKPVETPAVAEEEETYEPIYTTPQEDPDIKNLNGALDKILDIQHPDRVKQRSAKNKEAAYAVRKEKGADTLVKGFYSYSEPKELEEQNAVEAIIAANQTIVNGAVVKFRTVSDIYVNGKLIPKDNLISGIASLDGERLVIEINSIRSGKSLYNVKLEVYDMDGLPGIYIPGTINRDVAKESLNNSLSLADMTTLDPSFKAQATATGIGAVKSLISKKTKLVRVQVKAGYKVLLKNKN
jgi:conjugative transposon TraM protein